MPCRASSWSPLRVALGPRTRCRAGRMPARTACPDAADARRARPRRDAACAAGGPGGPRDEPDGPHADPTSRRAGRSSRGTQPSRRAGRSSRGIQPSRRAGRSSRGTQPSRRAGRSSPVRGRWSPRGDQSSRRRDGHRFAPDAPRTVPDAPRNARDARRGGPDARRSARALVAAGRAGVRPHRAGVLARPAGSVPAATLGAVRAAAKPSERRVGRCRWLGLVRCLGPCSCGLGPFGRRPAGFRGAGRGRAVARLAHGVNLRCGGRHALSVTGVGGESRALRCGGNARRGEDPILPGQRTRPGRRPRRPTGHPSAAGGRHTAPAR